MDEHLENSDIIVRFNGDLFTWSDSEGLRERLEPHFRVENEIFLATYPEGGVPPPDVIVQIFASSTAGRHLYKPCFLRSLRRTTSRYRQEGEMVRKVVLEMVPEGNIRNRGNRPERANHSQGKRADERP
jgi:hypothetical protein